MYSLLSKVARVGHGGHEETKFFSSPPNSMPIFTEVLLGGGGGEIRLFGPRKRMEL